MTHRLAVAGLLAALSLAASAPVAAQQRSTRFDGTPARAWRVQPVVLPLQADTSVVPTSTMVIAGIWGGLIGLFAGGFAGSLIERASTDPCGEWCGVGGAILGGVAGESIGIATGVHLANHNRGSWLLNATLLSAIGFGSGALALAIEGSATAPILLFTPIVQLILSPMIEERSAGR